MPTSPKQKEFLVHNPLLEVYSDIVVVRDAKYDQNKFDLINKAKEVDNATKLEQQAFNGIGEANSRLSSFDLEKGLKILKGYSGSPDVYTDDLNKQTPRKNAEPFFDAVNTLDWIIDRYLKWRQAPMNPAPKDLKQLANKLKDSERYTQLQNLKALSEILESLKKRINASWDWFSGSWVRELKSLALDVSQVIANQVMTPKQWDKAINEQRTFYITVDKKNHNFITAETHPQQQSADSAEVDDESIEPEFIMRVDELPEEVGRTPKEEGNAADQRRSVIIDEPAKDQQDEISVKVLKERIIPDSEAHEDTATAEAVSKDVVVLEITASLKQLMGLRRKQVFNNLQKTNSLDNSFTIQVGSTTTKQVDIAKEKSEHWLRCLQEFQEKLVSKINKLEKDQAKLEKDQKDGQEESIDSTITNHKLEILTNLAEDLEEILEGYENSNIELAFEAVCNQVQAVIDADKGLKTLQKQRNIHCFHTFFSNKIEGKGKKEDRKTSENTSSYKLLNDFIEKTKPKAMAKSKLAYTEKDSDYGRGNSLQGHSDGESPRVVR